MNVSKEQKIILNALLDKYERSATFRGDNKVTQNFQIKPEDYFKKYSDDAEYDFFIILNEELHDLEKAGYVSLMEERGRIRTIRLRTENLKNVYASIGRIPKALIISEVSDFLKEQKLLLKDLRIQCLYGNDVFDALSNYIDEQECRLENGKLPEYFDQDMTEYQDLWKSLIILPQLKEEIFVRDLSVRLYHDSKRLEQLRGKINSLLYKYGSYPDKETILEECGVIKNPSYVMIKGSVCIWLGKQKLDLGKMKGDIALSSGAISDIDAVHIYGQQLITIENLTSFHRFLPGKNTAVVYLGGYHNRIKRDFLKMIYSQNPDVRYYHFGDIDAGGFYIFEHLRRKTGIPFRVWKMDCDTLKKYMERAKKLTSNDQERLKHLRNEYHEKQMIDAEAAEILNTLDFMLERNLKLEQEALDENRFTE